MWVQHRKSHSCSHAEPPLPLLVCPVTCEQLLPGAAVALHSSHDANLGKGEVAGVRSMVPPWQVPPATEGCVGVS